MPVTPPFPLDQQICFTLYRLNMAVNRSYKPLLDELGLTYPQYLVLNALGEEDGRPIGVIAQRLALESSTITPLVKRMEEAGLVDRRRARDNERVVQVWLTESGRGLLQRCGCLNEMLGQRLGRVLPGLEEQNRQLQALLKELEAPAP
ncbi:MarR family transcriptional regulator [Roseomonas frigidaquae]|uniref:MarR family transcriptional regulator n=1 Tax=Falsiroseomonas frigidaquae TaxID=487318 RepID=A0ABX1ER88_9PROT|nr:MarR family transcriptional regulator [Falsiroseomonas frigidaquae]NKE43139.1 MarR family transcriptional regulator [Falsiroseomonas frigidaquae]